MRWILLSIFSIGVLLLLPELAFADNCSSPADCWGTAVGGAATAGGIGGGLWMWLWNWHKHKKYERYRIKHYVSGGEPHEHITEPPDPWLRERLSPEEIEEHWQNMDKIKTMIEYSRHHPPKSDVDLLMKFYKMYQRLATAVGGEEKMSSIAASGKA